MQKKVALHNLGCKVNAYEMDAMQQLLEEAGYTIVPFAPGADIYLINTCTVTNIADRKSRQMLHKAKKMNPDAIVVAAGCYVQADTKRLQQDEAVDLIIGNNCKKDLVSILQEYEKDRSRREQVIPINRTHEYENLSIDRTGEHTRAYIKVQDGCNQFCTYCIIPYARGRVRSREISSVLEEVRRLAASGYQEVVLTGIHLSSYGVDFTEDQKSDLLELIQTIHEVEGIHRIRLGSLEPRIITDEFVQGISRLPKICPHFHLSLQSGCDATLKRMNRRYNTEEYREKCRLLRRYFEKPALTTDVIVGFPGETEEEFAESLAFVEEIHFYETHIFKYSRRQGTKAAKMPDQIPEAVKGARSDQMLALGEKHAREYEEYWIGRKMEILLEEPYTAADGTQWITGHTPEYVKAAVPAGSGKSGDTVRAAAEGYLEGHILACRVDRQNC
ncbi:MAG TPA: tRNA (N(6)-L-threonylcarbamoyladenosine(37)-C(2))-methylthiotransferase MtaB [Candidatus Blautia gallistercoris]|uniref:Threonylcarbamoyladenosine tRNA methylthiotransferase MtaB n=1 Tax=Candidatus Blautia gallistercoris TaxID=2838490 RepID=A0A9D1WID9_9FIRM|nr:tRNA (N(6)-L-threonylcarbamoyladenosine(37)-C(2))-methylthiotransferase MtaB [Candidatus Blautia gallistercoris]